MKRIALLVCVLVLVVSNTAEARRNRGYSGQNYTQPVRTAPAYAQPAAAAPVAQAVAPASTQAVTDDDLPSEVAAASATATPAATATVTTASATSAMPAPVSYSTSTAQGVANLMASYNRVGHFGGNPGYEGCGCGATPAAAYAICCYGNSGMATVDVGYARSASGMWYCCRRYR